MGLKNPERVLRELQRAGVPEGDAMVLSRAAGLRGDAARRFVLANRNHAPVLSLVSQKRLFQEVVTPSIIADIERIFSKRDVVEMYGEAHWKSLSPVARALLFDLRYRGDYTPRTRRLIQPLLVAGDDAGLESVIRDRAYWRSLGVPDDRISRRIAIVTDRLKLYSVVPSSDASRR
jgi:hypothetical protein